MSYKEELIKAMEMLSRNDKVRFIGQEVATNKFYKTMGNVPIEQMKEFPIAEDVQLGLSIGYSLMGFIPVSMFTRMDFFLLAMNQLISHLDKIEEMSHGDFKPKVIIRTVVGEHVPMDCGPQHTQDFTEMLKTVLKNVKVVRLESKFDIVPAYKEALESDVSTILIEIKEFYNKET